MTDVKKIVDSMNLGVSRKTLEGSKDSPMHTLMIGIHQDILEQLGKSVEKYGASASNRLKQSMITVDKSADDKIDISVSMNFYWKYVNFGVNGTKINRGAPTWGPAPGGTMSFKEAIKGWIRDKGMVARPGQTYDQMAYAIMNSVKEKGMKARPFYTDVVNRDLKKFLTKSISEVFGEALRIEIKDPWQ